VLGDVVLLGALGGVVLLGALGGVVAPAAPVPEPKNAFHSSGEIEPLPSLSTAEKLGACELAPADADPLALGRVVEPDAPAALLPDALGACDLSVELCAMAALARANSAAAVAVLMSFNIWSFLLRRWM
jgi:hypothetical protein